MDFLLPATHKPFTLRFGTVWQVTGQKQGASALALKSILGLGSYRTAWAWLHKFRRAMVTPGQDRLAGTIEVDETYMGRERPGKRGRGAAGRTLVLIAAEANGTRIGKPKAGLGTRPYVTSYGVTRASA